MKKKTIKISILLVLFIIFILIFLLFIKWNDRDNNISMYSNNTEQKEKKVEQILMTTDYFEIKNIIEKYYSNCKKLNTDINDLENRIVYSQDEMKEYQKKEINNMQNLAVQVIYGILDKSYLEEFNIKKTDIKDSFGIKSKVDVMINKIYKINVNNNISMYLVFGATREILTNKYEEINLMIDLDRLNNTYLLYPADYIEKHQCNKVIEDSENIEKYIDIKKHEIENTGYNKYDKFNTVSDNEIAKEYFYNYKNTMLCDKNVAYNMLDNALKKSKFETIEKYEKYIQENEEKFKNLIISKFQVKEYKNLKHYICLDQNENYYIFEINGDKECKVYLDTYTVDLPEFIDKYNKSNDQEKVILNIGKVISAINNDDFKYFYNKLADSFKNNYFENEDALKNYWLDNLYKKNKVEFMDFNREGNLYTYKLKITKQYEEGEESTFGKDAPSSFINIVMQLKEGTDFVMSFSVLEQ